MVCDNLRLCMVLLRLLGDHNFEIVFVRLVRNSKALGFWQVILMLSLMHKIRREVVL